MLYTDSGAEPALRSNAIKFLCDESKSLLWKGLRVQKTAAQEVDTNCIMTAEESVHVGVVGARFKLCLLLKWMFLLHFFSK